MNCGNFGKIILFNILGAALFLSWYIPGRSGFWFAIDKDIFYYFNDLLPVNEAFMYFVAFVNLRPFDAVAFLAMLAIFYTYYRKQDARGKRKMFCIGIAMLLSAVIVKQITVMMPVHHPSPTKFFENVNLVSQLSGWKTKDGSGDSFPSDHGIMLLIFSVYMWKYFGCRAFLKCLAVFLIFSLPRIMGGAHWFTDVAVGSVSVACVVMSWILLTPAADFVVGKLQGYVPEKWFMKK